MIQNSRSGILFSFLIFLSLGLLTSCGPASTCDACEGCEEKCAALEEQMYDYEELGNHTLIREYHRLTQEKNSADVSDDSTNVYVDISNGMRQPLTRDTEIKGLFSDLRNLLLDEDPAFHQLYGNSITRMKPMSKGELDSYFHNEKNYNQAYAPLGQAVDEIAANPGRESVLITDGELWTSAQPYPTSNHSYAWGAAGFRKWLEGDNEIDIVIRTFSPKGRSGISQMRFFMIFFTPRDKAITNESLVGDYMKKLTNSGKEGLITHLNFSQNAYKLQDLNPNNLPKDEAGLNSVMASNWLYTIDRQPARRFQHIHYEDKPADFVDFMNNFVDGEYNDEMDRRAERDKLFYDLEITNHFVNYDILEVKARTYDMTRPLAELRKHIRCTISDTVIITPDEGSMAKDTIWCNPEFDCRPASECGDYSPTVSSISEMFDIHEEFYNNWEPEDESKGNIAIRPAKTFNPDNLYNYSHFKIEVYIEEAKYKEREGFELLAWRDNSSSSPQVNGLQESMKQAMESLEPKDKVIYTYYLTVGDILYEDEL